MYDIQYDCHFYILLVLSTPEYSSSILRICIASEIRTCHIFLDEASRQKTLRNIVQVNAWKDNLDVCLLPSLTRDAISSWIVSMKRQTLSLCSWGVLLKLYPIIAGFQIATLARPNVMALNALSEKYMENDLVAVQPPDSITPRLCAVKQYGAVSPLCRHEDNVETDLFVDPRNPTKFYETLSDTDVIATYGEGFYGQRPVPSLGGGPGYGASADEIWSVGEDILQQVVADGVDLPILDVGIAHGEKARGGAY